MMVKKVFVLFLFVLLFCMNGYGREVDGDLFFHDVTSFLGKHVHDGLVDYGAIAADRAELDRLIEYIEQNDPPSLSDQAYRKALWINAYNLLVLKGIVDEWPVTSPKEIPSFFDRSRRVAAKKLSLNDIENKEIRAIHGDPRIHFALVCATRSCPILINKAYAPSTLETQLDERTRASVNDVRHVRYDTTTNTVFLSRLFQWYGEDFKTGSQSVIEWINPYRESSIPSDATIRFLDYDWTVNAMSPPAPDEHEYGEHLRSLQDYTPSTLLSPGGFEFKFFNNLYTQTAFFDEGGKKVDLDDRSSYNTLSLSLLYGFTSRINAGFDVTIKSVRIDDKSASPFGVFSFSSDEQSHSAVTSFAPKVKVTPFSSLGNLAFQTAVVFPISDDPEGLNHERPFLDYEDIQWWTQLYYDYSFGSAFLIYGEGDLLLRFDKSEDSRILTTPLKVILNYYPTQRWTVYLPLEYAPTWKNGDVSSFYSQVGLGVKYQILPQLEIEALGTVFPLGKSSGAGVTYNLGLRYLW